MTKDNDRMADSSGFLSRWSTRKAQIKAGVDEVSDEPTALVAEDGVAKLSESEEEATLSDTDLLEKYELPDPATVDEETDLDCFFDGKAPDRLRQLALRRVWRLNPMFGFVDDMVEYGEDYTDAATVVEGMQTAYQVGKGYLKKVLGPEEETELQVEQALPKEKLGDDVKLDTEVNKNKPSPEGVPSKPVESNFRKTTTLNGEELGKGEKNILVEDENQLNVNHPAPEPKMLDSSSDKPHDKTRPSRMVFVKSVYD